MSSTFSIEIEKDLSPNAMAKEAFDAGIADRKRRQTNDENEATIPEKRTNVDANIGADSEPEKRLEAIWNSFLKATPQDDGKVNDSKQDHLFETAAEATSSLVQTELEKFFREGLEAFHKCDSLIRELNQSKELCDARGKELLRLQTSEAESKHLVSVRRFILFTELFHANQIVFSLLYFITIREKESSQSCRVF